MKQFKVANTNNSQSVQYKLWHEYHTSFHTPYFKSTSNYQYLYVIPGSPSSNSSPLFNHDGLW